MGRWGRQGIIHRAAWAALFAVALCPGCPGNPPGALAWSEFGTVAEKPVANDDGREIQEPFFEFMLHMVSTDSLGQWSGSQMRSYAQARNRDSRFPLEQIVSLSRTRPDSVAAGRYAGAPVQAVWHIVLAGPQDRSMPYSILGYHPGSLRIGAELVLSELFPGDVDLDLEQDGQAAQQTVTGVRVFALEAGFVLLDADAWLDALLGAGLDDAWSLGFVVGREDGRWLGLGVSLGREGRHIYGEFDFANDKVLAHGRPLASALSRFSRNWLNVRGGNLPEPWVEP